MIETNWKPEPNSGDLVLYFGDSQTEVRIARDAALNAESTGALDAIKAEAERVAVGELLTAKRELNNYKLKLADFDNARKRMLRDAEVERRYAVEPLARDLIAALDNLDRALDAAKRAGDAGPLATGVSATAAQFLDALKRHGITRIECPPGTAFDPNLHQAVMQRPGTAFGPGEVAQVLQHGFLIHDRVLRPASVVVATGDEIPNHK